MLLSRNLPLLRYSLGLGAGAALLALRVSSIPSREAYKAFYGMSGLGLIRPLRRQKSSGKRAARSAETKAAALRKERIFRQISETLPDLLYVYDLTEQRNIYVNREVGSLLGYTPEEIQAMGSALLARLIHPDDLPAIEASHIKIAALPDGETVETEYRVQRKAGDWLWLCSRESVFTRSSDGSPTQKLGIAQDITERKKAQEAIHWQAALLRHTTDAATLGFYVADSKTDAALYYNTRFLELWGLAELAPQLQSGAMTHTELMAHCLPKIESGDGETTLWEPLQSVAHRDGGEDEIRLKNGRILRRSATEIHGDATACFGRFYLFEDVTAQRFLEEQLETQLAHIQETNVQLEMQAHMLNQANAQLERLATTDGLTGLQNNRAFRDFLGKSLAQSRRSGAELSLILFDVDRFKQYNDAYGHPAGDEVLKGVARILQKMTRVVDCAARYGGEEFVLILPDTGAEGASLLAERLRTALEAQTWAHRPVTASFGVATQSQGRQDAAALIAEADRALYGAKHRGHNRVIHARELPPEFQENAA